MKVKPVPRKVKIKTCSRCNVATDPRLLNRGWVCVYCRGKG